VSDFLTDLGRVAKLTGRGDMTPDALAYFVGIVLEQVPEPQACAALRKWSISQARFPTPADVLKLALGEPATARDEATEVASAILKAISRRGYVWSDTYRYDGHASFDAALMAECGEAALLVVQRCGTWRRLCEEFGADEHARARLRDLAEAAIKSQTRVQARVAIEQGRQSDQIKALVENIAAGTSMAAIPPDRRP
jgi:hypothetical protein